MTTARHNIETWPAGELAGTVIAGFRNDVAAGHFAIDERGWNELATRMASVIQGDRDRVGEVLRFYGFGDVL